MCSLLEALTHSGRPSLDQQLMKRVKGICKSTHLYFISILILNLFFTFVCYTQPIRLLFEGYFNALICSENSSHQTSGDLFLSLAHHTPAPPPTTAEQLKEEIILLAIHQWVKIKNWVQLLKHNKKVHRVRN